MNTFVAVRTLCEFTAKTGDLDLRFTPSATALEGMAGHALVTARRGEGYESEIALSCAFEGLTVRGRADGFDAARNMLEEIKTYRGDLSAMPANRRALHWAQAQVYAWMLCRERALPEISVSLVYYDVGTQLETVLVERHAASALQALFEDRCRRYAAWAAGEATHRAHRDAALTACRFPHADFRPGQRHLSETVYKAAQAGRTLMAQAPTGIGKTVGTLFPLLKAMPARQMDKVFFLAAKGPGRGVALAALQAIGVSDLPVRVLELVSREKSCEHPGKACHGEACPLARGFFDRLPAARGDVVARPTMDRDTLKEVARAHRVCPYYLSQEMVRWADVIVGDYNYWFDGNAVLHGMTVANEWQVGVLVDEAHNLVERGRAMYSGSLERSRLRAALAVAPARLKAGLKRLERVWDDLDGQQFDPQGRADSSTALPAEPGQRVLDAMPESLANALQHSMSALADYLLETPAGQALTAESPLLRWHFDVLAFRRLLDSFGDHSLLELTAEPAGGAAADAAAGASLRLRNVVPGPFLKSRWAAAQTTALFSATLTPSVYYADLLGLPEDTAHVDVPSPFASSQLRVEIVDHVSTRFSRRRRSWQPIAEIMAAQHRREPGNYLAFFSSFDYLNDVASLFESLHPDVPTWRQSRQMDDTARAAFLARFDPGGSGIGFAVLGGAFGEGIDLPGRRLAGAFIATLGLPPVNAANEQVRSRLDLLFGADHGRDYAYLYPGITKVVQAAGRVIRSPSDRGTLHLIDDRYAGAAVRALLPAWWNAGAKAPTVNRR